MSIRVFLVDDHEVVRRGVRELLEPCDDIEIVGEAGTAEEALSRIPPTRPNVAVIDMRLPDGNGVEICREVRSRDANIHCLILTSFADDEALFDAIMAGAAGYLLKQVKGTDFVDAVRRVATGQSLLDPAVTAQVLERLRKGPEEDERLARLTEQERKILDLIAEGLTNRQIAERMFLAEKTVKNYVSHLLPKLGMERRGGGRKPRCSRLAFRTTSRTTDPPSERAEHRGHQGPSTLGSASSPADDGTMLIDEGLELLSEQQCVELLQCGGVGRVGCHDPRPAAGRGLVQQLLHRRSRPGHRADQEHRDRQLRTGLRHRGRDDQPRRNAYRQCDAAADPLVVNPVSGRRFQCVHRLHPAAGHRALKQRKVWGSLGNRRERA